MSASPTISVLPPLSSRRKVAYCLATAALTVALLLPLVLLDRPPQSPRLTFIGVGEGLSILVEGAGGGRVLIGGGATQSDLPAALGRQLRPWDTMVDLVLVTDRRDLPGATELVRRGRVRAAAVVGLSEERAAAAALVALRESCAARGVPVRDIVADERIAVGRDADMALDVLLSPGDAQNPTLRLVAGTFTATVISGATLTREPTLGAILLRPGQEPYRAAFAAEPRLLVATARPDLPDDRVPVDRQLLLIAPGARTTLTIEGASWRVRGAGLVPLESVPVRR